jgi:hypothetical protein
MGVLWALTTFVAAFVLFLLAMVVLGRQAAGAFWVGLAIWLLAAAMGVFVVWRHARVRPYRKSLITFDDDALRVRISRAAESEIAWAAIRAIATARGRNRRGLMLAFWTDEAPGGLAVYEGDEGFEALTAELPRRFEAIGEGWTTGVAEDGQAKLLFGRSGAEGQEAGEA